MDHFGHVDDALKAVADAQKVIRRGSSTQVRSGDERDHMRTVALAWFKNIRPQIEAASDSALLADVDAPIRRVLDSTAKAAARATYSKALGEARKALLDLRKDMPTEVEPIIVGASNDLAPNFAPLASEPRMQAIMARRWQECVLCLDGKASLAAVVMMGGLIESLFVSKANHLDDKSVLAKAKRAPTHKGKSKPFQEWTLNDYIEVGHELEWIGDIAKKVGAVLRDYRNFVHPQAEFRQQTVVSEQDARLLWEVAKALSRELLAGA